MIKSLRSTGTSTALRTLRISSRLPLKNGSSVSTEIAAAPYLAYVRPSATGSNGSISTPFDGDACLTSAISATVLASRRSAASISRGGVTTFTASSNRCLGDVIFALLDFLYFAFQNFIQYRSRVRTNLGCSCPANSWL